MEFVRATKAQARARMALIGPSGSGKTYTALLFAQVLGERVALIDTEHGSASKYADEVVMLGMYDAAPWQVDAYKRGLAQGVTASRVFVTTQYNGSEADGKHDRYGNRCTLRTAAELVSHERTKPACRNANIKRI